MKRPSLRRPLLLPLCLAALLAVPAGATAAAAAVATETLELAPCNRTYRMRGAELAPVTQGGMVIALTSPENHLTLARHRLELTPRGDGTHDARFVADFSGGGDLVADVTVGTLTQRLEDRVEVPRQERTVEARVRLARSEAGYELTPLELPEHVVIDVDSQLASRFAGLCQGLSLVMAINCRPLQAALSRARVPMPEPGETYLLPPECLTDELRGRLDEYLAGTGAGTGADAGAGTD